MRKREGDKAKVGPIRSELHYQEHHHHQGEEGSFIYECHHTSFKFLQAWRCARSYNFFMTSTPPPGGVVSGQLGMPQYVGVVRTALSDKGAICWPEGSVKTQQGRERTRDHFHFWSSSSASESDPNNPHLYTGCFF